MTRAHGRNEVIMDDSILYTIKSMIGGIVCDTGDFDVDLIVNINSAFSILHQLGLGPKKGFKIAGETETWTEFLGDDSHLEDAKTYVYLRTKLNFDPPANSFLVNSIEKQLTELEWRLNVAQETPAFEEEE